MGEDVLFSGRSLLHDILGKAGYFQVLVLNVTGRMPERRFTDWLETAFICVGWPDARLWCNQIGTWGGQARTSPVAAACAGILASDSRLYGPGTALRAAAFINEALEAHEAGKSAADIVEGRCRRGRVRESFPGYARPLVRGDERVRAMERLARALGYGIGPRLRLAYAIQDVLEARWGEALNLAGYMAAFMADQGYTAEEGYRITSLLVSGGVHACYAEAADQPAESFLPLRCEDIEYTGKSEREVPEDE